MMRITYFKIENFRNIRLAECANPPDFIVICGGNGCGKSALLQALMTAKEHAAPYGGFNADPRSVSADADKATIELHIGFSDIEREWYRDRSNHECPESDAIVIEIEQGGRARATKRSDVTKTLLSWYSREFQASPGFFDYIDAHRLHIKKNLSTWDASSLNDSHIKQSLGAQSQRKFDYTKEYLASLVLGDLQRLQTKIREGVPEPVDSLEPIREFFNRFFAPMEFVEVRIDCSPFEYIIRTPRGDIDIDDLSAGEKEILNTFIRFHQLQPSNAVILFDEADAHLHPDLERRYLDVLRNIGHGNQLWLTTHSPEMMIEAGSDALFTVLKEPPNAGDNQFVRVTSSDELHSALSELMGSRGLVSFNQRIVFIEGADSSVDRQIYEKLYPPGIHNVSFVPAGDSGAVRKTAERVNELLSSAVGFQHYYSIVDGDIERGVDPPANGRLCRLPVYHVENFLIDDECILRVLRGLLGEQCPYPDAAAVTAELETLLIEDGHLNPFARALLDARLSRAAKEAYDAVYANAEAASARPDFASAKTDARALMEVAVQDGDWRDKCKGRDLLKALCHKHNVRYEHFRNLLVDGLNEPPPRLQAIMGEILRGD